MTRVNAAVALGKLKGEEGDRVDSEEVTVVFPGKAGGWWTSRCPPWATMGRSRVLFEPLYTMVARHS